MHVLRTVGQDLEEDYGILCKSLFPKEEDDALFGFTWAEVPVGGTSLPHAHPECEAFVIAGGSGELHIGGSQTDLISGDTAFIPANTEHTIRNTGEGSLKFVAIWWEESVDRPPVDV